MRFFKAKARSLFPSLPNCPVGQLDWYVNSTLSPAQKQTVESHLLQCITCQARVAELAVLQRRLREVYIYTPQPRFDLVSQVEQRLDLLPVAAPGVRAWLNHLRQNCRLALSVGGDHFRMQAHLIRREIFWIPLLVIPLLGLMVYFPNPWIRTPGTVALFATFLSALSMALLYNKRIEPARELTLATPTSPCLIIGIRCGLVLGYSLLLNFGLILPFLTFQGIVTPGWFLSNWLAPMCCLSAIALFFSVAFNANASLLICSIVWGLRSLDGIQVILFGHTPLFTGTDWQQLYENFWQQGPLLFAVAIGLIFLTFVVVERKENVV